MRGEAGFQDARIEPPPTGGAVGVGFDRWFHAQIGHATAGVSPAALLLAYTDWLAHLMLSPGKQLGLQHEALRTLASFALYLPRAVDSKEPWSVEPDARDHRFADPAWREWPYNVVAQSFLSMQRWWHAAMTDVRGVERHHENVVDFVTRQQLDVFAPSNFVPTNPEVLQRTWQTFGANLAHGWMNFWDDVRRQYSGAPVAGAESYRIGVNVAATPGKVVMRNELAELIQYAPATAKVYPEPVLIVPAWIMKYYLLDLQAQDSLVKYLVDQGHTVFCVSWKNPGGAERELGLEDYLRLGVYESLDAVRTIVPGCKIHAMGYCLGGTLLAIAAAAMARDGDERLATMSLLATETDFSEPGEIALFIDNSEVSFLEDIMFDRGFLERGEMAGAFELLRSNDLIWSRAVREYLIGERARLTGLMFWNQDSTRMPYRMHSQYLRRMFLNNDLAAARFPAGGKPVALSDVALPIFCLGTETDHVAPWRSVYKIHLLNDGEITFVLTKGGHNTGVVSPPGSPGRNYRIYVRPDEGKYIAPDQYLARAETRDGSWWGEWQAWLARRSQAVASPPTLGAPGTPYAPQADAPGRYVFER